MTRRPIRVTVSCSPDEYEQLAWLAFKHDENPSTYAYNLMADGLADKFGTDPDLASQYEMHHRSRLQVIPGRKEKRGTESTAGRASSDGGANPGDADLAPTEGDDRD